MSLWRRWVSIGGSSCGVGMMSWEDDTSSGALAVDCMEPMSILPPEWLLMTEW
jgi:hypothetical protein